MPRKATNGLDLSGQRAINLADPTAAQDAATKAYVDSKASAGGGGGITAAQARTIARRATIRYAVR